jgi:hypothetical protein
VKRKAPVRTKTQGRRATKKSLTVRLTEEAWQVILDSADELGLDRTSVVEMAIRHYGRSKGKL